MRNLLFLCMLLSAYRGFSQQADISFINQTYINLNPAFAGSNGLFRYQSYFQQWRHGDSPAQYYNTYVNAADGYLAPLRSGIAAYTSSSENGIYRQTFSSISYAGYLSLFNKTLKITPAVQLGYGTSQKDKDAYWISEPNRNYGDVGAGLLINYKRLYVGASLFHINRPEANLYYGERMPRHLTVHASYNLQIAKVLLVNFSGMVTADQHYGNGQLLFNLNLLLFRHIILGTGTSVIDDDIIIFNAGYKGNFFTLQAGYNRYYGISSTLNKYYGTWQLMASFNLRNKELRRQVTNFEAW